MASSLLVVEAARILTAKADASKQAYGRRGQENHWWRWQCCWHCRWWQESAVFVWQEHWLVDMTAPAASFMPNSMNLLTLWCCLLWWWHDDNASTLFHPCPPDTVPQASKSTTLATNLAPNWLWVIIANLAPNLIRVLMGYQSGCNYWYWLLVVAFSIKSSCWGLTTACIERNTIFQRHHQFGS